MPLLIAIPIALGLIVFGAIRLYTAAASRYGWLAGIAANAAVVALLAAIVLALARRHRYLHGVRAGGHRILSHAAGATLIEVDADHQRGRLHLDGREAPFIFADIDAAQAVRTEAAWLLRLRLRHNATPSWDVPMPSRKEARRWERILMLAAAQKL